MVARVQLSVFEARRFRKAPPGPPPPGKEHLDWKDETRRWVCPAEGCEDEHDHRTEGIESDIAAIFDSDTDFNEALDRMDASAEEWSSENEDDLRSPYTNDAFEHYTAEGYGQINNFVSKGEVEGVGFLADDEEQEILTEFVASMVDEMYYISDVTLFRGAKVPIELEDGSLAQAGDVVTLDRFTSTSRSPSVAMNFAREVFLQIEATYGTTGIHMDSGEHETILEYGQRLRIDSIELKQFASTGMSIMFVKGTMIGKWA